jgi:2'-5' RNA ligase
MSDSFATGRDPTIRAFVAVELPPEQRQFCTDAIERARRTLGSIGRSVRWVDASGIHLTLKFLGSVPAPQVPQLDERLRAELRGQPPFDLAVGKLGVFPNLRAPRVLWLGLHGNLAALSAAQERVEAATEPLGFPREKRPFQAHLTLGRVREGAARDDLAAIGRLPGGWPEASGPPFRVSSVSLMQSHLSPAGAKYTQIAEFRLGDE